MDIVVFDYITFPVFTRTTRMTHFQVLNLGTKVPSPTAFPPFWLHCLFFIVCVLYRRLKCFVTPRLITEIVTAAWVRFLLAQDVSLRQTTLSVGLSLTCPLWLSAFNPVNT